MNSTEAVGNTIDNNIAGCIILITASISVFVNGLTTSQMVRVKDLRNSFGFLCVSQGIADCGVLFIFAVWCAPVTFSQSSIATEVLGKKVGQLSLFFWFGGIYSTLLTGVNRFVAISFPVRYRQLFTNYNTIRLIIGCWILATCHVIFYFFNGCDFFYEPLNYVWEYADTPCGNIASFYLDFCFGVAAFIIIFTLNVATAIKLRISNQQARLVNQTTTQTTSEIRDQVMRRKREIRFFVQACINGASFNVMLISFHVLSLYAWDKWSLFATTSLVWQLAHSSNGFVFLIFNRNLRQLVLHPLKICEAPEPQGKLVNVKEHVNQGDRKNTDTEPFAISKFSKKSVISAHTIHLNNFIE